MKPSAPQDTETISRRRVVVWNLYLKMGANFAAVARAMRKDPQYAEFGKPVADTIRKDVKAYQDGLVAAAEAMFSDQKKAVADYIRKTLDLRERALGQGDLRLVASLDKDLLKFVGVNLDRVEVAVFGGGEGDNAPRSFPEMMNEIRRRKGLPALPEGNV